MFWTLLIVAGLTGLAYGWIVVRTSNERITISFEVARIRQAFRMVKEGALAVVHRGKDFQGRHSQHS